jgi:proteasome lid subunit RPN8/RPN11
MNDQSKQVVIPASAVNSLVIKRGEDFEWPEDRKMFYLLASTGLFKCRNHEFFRSCVPATKGPGELVQQESFMECGFPTIPRELFEQTVGFFDEIRKLHNSEASVLLAFDRENRSVHLVVPEQTATVIRYSDGYQYPVGLYYYPPTDLPANWILFGDIHSHVDMAAYSSETDVEDETHSAGLHIVVGRLYKEPMETHVEAVVDGERFSLQLEDVIEGYTKRSKDVPTEWIAKVKTESKSNWTDGYGSSSWSADGWASSTSSKDGKQLKGDEEVS